MYSKQSAAIKIEGNLGRRIMILEGARQGCVTSPGLFNRYVENIFLRCGKVNYSAVHCARTKLRIRR